MGTLGRGDVWQASLEALPSFFKRKACHHYPDIPTFRVGSLNHGPAGLGAMDTNGRQYRMTRRNMETLMAKCDVVFSQETKFQTKSYLESYVEWKAFKTKALRKEAKEGEKKKRKRWSAGGVIWVRRTLLRNFEEPRHVVRDRKGLCYVHYNVLQPKATVDLRYPVFTRYVP